MNYFKNLVWTEDRMKLNKLTFRLQHYKNDATWDLGDNCFIFFKTKELIDQYEKYFSGKPDFRPTNIFEIGLYEGGSIAFWYELFKPRKIVGVDIQNKVTPPYLKQYIHSNKLEDNIKIYWNTDQTDRDKLKYICVKEFASHMFASPLDVVIDDASHFYSQTKKSFEVLFPMLRPGGLYIIEDWSWSHYSPFQQRDHPWAQEIDLTKLVFDLVEAAGSATYIASISVFQCIAIIEKGNIPIDPHQEFRVENIISRRPF